MSRFRKVDPRMWGDAKFRQLSEKAKFLWLYLLTGPETTSLPGLIVGGEAHFAEAMGWTVEDFREAFQEVFRQGMAKADWGSRLVWVRNSIRYNHPESPNVVRGWRDHWDNLPECNLKAIAFEGLFSDIQAFSEGYRKAFLEACAKPKTKTKANQEQEQEQEQEPTAEHEPCQTSNKKQENMDRKPVRRNAAPVAAVKEDSFENQVAKTLGPKAKSVVQDRMITELQLEKAKAEYVQWKKGRTKPFDKDAAFAGWLKRWEIPEQEPIPLYHAPAPKQLELTDEQKVLEREARAKFEVEMRAIWAADEALEVEQKKRDSERASMFNLEPDPNDPSMTFYGDPGELLRHRRT